MEDDQVITIARETSPKMGVLQVALLCTSVIGLFTSIWIFTFCMGWYLYRRFRWYGLVPFLLFQVALIASGDFHKIMLLTAFSSIPFILWKMISWRITDPKLAKYLP